jgi:hypothetical protein
MMKRLLLTALLAGFAASAAHAVLGDTAEQLRMRLGKPEPQTRKDALVWFFEVEDGRLIYQATLDEKGLSVAEGLKPLKRALFTTDVAQDFIDRQMAPIKGSKTIHTYQPGESYAFGGKQFTCAKDEFATVDTAHDFLLVWNRSRDPSVYVIRSRMVQ